MLHVWFLVLMSCEEGLFYKDKKSQCISIEILPSPPYDDPIWHPSGRLIAFNHTPIKKITYTARPGCPDVVSFEYNYDSLGFWLVDNDGTDKRRVLPYELLSPAWSPDGEWIAFANGGEIFKMPFDGENFDTTAITRLTFEGRNFYPAWSRDSKWIAFDNTNCGSATSPVPPNSCGILVMDAQGNNRKFIGGPTRMPYWGNGQAYVYSYNARYNLLSGSKEILFDISNEILFAGAPKFSPDTSAIAFIGQPAQGGVLKLYSITPEGQDLKTISSDTIRKFSWSPVGKIVYLKFDGRHLGTTKGTLWTMDANGMNQQPITFNYFITETNN